MIMILKVPIPFLICLGKGDPGDKLHITVISGRNLRERNMNGTGNYFVQVGLGDILQETEVVVSSAPVWDHDCVFDLPAVSQIFSKIIIHSTIQGKPQEVIFDIFHEEEETGTSLPSGYASVILPTKEMLDKRGKPVTMWVPTNQPEKYGEIQIRTTYATGHASSVAKINPPKHVPNKVERPKSAGSYQISQSPLHSGQFDGFDFTGDELLSQSEAMATDSIERRGSFFFYHLDLMTGLILIMQRCGSETSGFSFYSAKLLQAGRSFEIKVAMATTQLFKEPRNGSQATMSQGCC